AEPAGYANTKGIAHVTANYETADYEYTYHGGTHVVGSNPSYGFLLQKLGQKSAQNVNIDTSALPAGVITLATPSSFSSLNAATPVTFNYTPSAAGIHDSYIVISYENRERVLKDQTGAINTSGTSANYHKKVVKIKIRVIFEAVEADGNDVDIAMENFDVQYDNILDQTSESLIPGSTAITSKFLTAVGADSITYKAIKGSPVYVKKKFTFTNTSATNTVEDFIFTLKKSEAQTSVFLGDASVGISTENNTCNTTSTVGSDLGPGASCSVEVKFLAPETATTATNVAHLSYRLKTNQYTAKMFSIVFEANPPAILTKAATSPIIVNSGGNNISAYPVRFGSYTQAGHIILSSFPTEVSQPLSNPFVINNSSTTKASFLKQYEEHVGGEPPEGQVWTEIFDNGRIQVEAERTCFYGDDEVSGPDQTTWGFATGTSPCRMRVNLSLQDQYLGKDMVDNENLIPLKFYNNERNQFDSIYLVMQGFVEPNKSVQSNQNLTNISVGAGTLSFDWNPLSEQNPNWGPITGYRVFYGTNTSLLSNVFNAGGAQTYDTVTPSLSLSNLVKGTFYYFKITALRTTGGKTYVSDSNMPLIEFVIPPDGTFYDPINHALIDRGLQPGSVTKAQAIALCDSLNHQLSRNGATINPRRELIDSNIWAVLDANPDESDYPHAATALHWMADSPISIAPYFPGYQCTDTSGLDLDDSEIFEKSCDDCTCDTLSLIRGSDGDSLPVNTKYYTDGDALAVSARCWIDLNGI
ncbi:MAG: fibronectin type III domain-containing protein, partial [Deltaproteobacteria bacterium]